MKIYRMGLSSVLLMGVMALPFSWSQSPEQLRKQYKETRQLYTRALEQLDTIDRHLAAGKQKEAGVALEELVALKARLEQAE